MIRTSTRYAVAVLVVAILGITAGLVLALVSASAGGHVAPQARPPKAGLSGEAGSALQVVDLASPEILFPPHLSGLSTIPTDLAVGSTGDLWFVGAAEDGQVTIFRSLAGGSPDVESYSISVASESAQTHLAFDPDGRLLIAAGSEVFRLDPETFEFETVKLPPVRNVASDDYSDGAAGSVIEMRSEGELVFLSRLGASSLTQLDFETQDTRDISVPGSFGGFDDFRVSNSEIWLLKTGDTLDGPPAQVAILHRSGGSFKVTPVKPFAGVLSGPDLVVASWDPPGLVRISADGSYDAENDKLDPQFLEEIGPESWVADTARGLWLVDKISGSVVWVSKSNHDPQRFQLPSWELPGDRVNCAIAVDCSAPVAVLTQITSIAAGADGTLYLADSTLGRIGLIQAPE